MAIASSCTTLFIRARIDGQKVPRRNSSLQFLPRIGSAGIQKPVSDRGEYDRHSGVEGSVGAAWPTEDLGRRRNFGWFLPRSADTEKGFRS